MSVSSSSLLTRPINSTTWVSVNCVNNKWDVVQKIFPTVDEKHSYNAKVTTLKFVDLKEYGTIGKAINLKKYLTKLKTVEAFETYEKAIQSAQKIADANQLQFIEPDMPMATLWIGSDGVMPVLITSERVAKITDSVPNFEKGKEVLKVHCGENVPVILPNYTTRKSDLV